MGTKTKIEWCDHTFNPWIGCSKVSSGCAHCYAEAFAKRTKFARWGDDGTRVRTSANYWRAPRRWDEQAERDGVRRRVFCASHADVFEQRAELEEIRLDLFNVIRLSPNLDWLLLTKRIQHAAEWLAEYYRDWEELPNVWIGTSVEDQAAADERIPWLLKCPAAVRFLSCEPLLGPIDLNLCAPPDTTPWIDNVDWVIVGGESGAWLCVRNCLLAHVRSIVDQCRAAGVPCFVKQLGTKATDGTHYEHLLHPKGGDPDEWPADLRVREFPEVRGEVVGDRG